MQSKTITKKPLVTLLLLILLVLSATCAAIAHSGRTDGSGGHNDNKNKSGLGSYHYHCGGKPAHLHTDGNCPYQPTPKATPKPIAPASQVFPVNMPSEILTGDELKLEWNSENTRSVMWVSENPEKLFITEDGEMLALAPGNVELTANMDNGNSSYTVLVRPKKVEDIGIIDKPEILQLGSNIQLDVEIFPEDAYEQGVKWTSSNKRVITVDKDGNLKILKAGKARITVTSLDNKKINDFVDIVIDAVK